MKFVYIVTCISGYQTFFTSKKKAMIYLMELYRTPDGYTEIYVGGDFKAYVADDKRDNEDGYYRMGDTVQVMIQQRLLK